MAKQCRWLGGMAVVVALGLFAGAGEMGNVSSLNAQEAPAPAPDGIQLRAQYKVGEVETVTLKSNIQGQQHYFFPGTTYPFGFEHEESFVEEVKSITGGYKRLHRSGMREEEVTQGPLQGDNPDRLLPSTPVKLGTSWEVRGDEVVSIFKWCGGSLTRLGLGSLTNGWAKGTLASYTDDEAKIDLEVYVRFYYEKGRGTHITDGTFVGTMIFDRKGGKVRSVELKGEKLFVRATWYWGQGIGEVKGFTKDSNTSNEAHGTISYKRVAGGAPKPWASQLEVSREPVNAPKDLQQYRLTFHSDRTGNFNVFALNLGTGEVENLTKSETYDWNATWSPDGKTYAFASDRQKGLNQIFTADIGGGNLKQLTTNGANAHLSWSPDGQWIAFTSTRDLPDPIRQMNNGELYVMKADGSDQRRLTDHPDPDGVPTWSPDSKTIAFQSKREGNFEIYLIDVDGKNLRRLMEATPSQEIQPGWSPDGKRIAFVSDRDGANAQNIYIYNLETKQLQRVTYQQGQNFFPTWSPDGKYVIFQSMRSGNWDIYAADPNGKEQYRLTTHSGDERYPVFIPKK